MPEQLHGNEIDSAEAPAQPRLDDPLFSLKSDPFFEPPRQLVYIILD